MATATALSRKGALVLLLAFVCLLSAVGSAEAGRGLAPLATNGGGAGGHGRALKTWFWRPTFGYYRPRVYRPAYWYG